jgi:hypothetical protein
VFIGSDEFWNVSDWDLKISETLADGVVYAIVPDSVTDIGFNAFAYCNGLATVSIGKGVKTIAYNAFYSCDGLTEILIPGNVLSLGDCALADCDSLERVIIEDGVSKIEDGAFADCDKLVDVCLPNTITSINDNLSFLENLTTFASNQNTLYRYVGYSDSEFQKLMHTTYNSSFIETYYSIAFSFIPYSKPDNLDFRIYSNGKCALPAYLALLYNMDNGKIDIAYDVQTKIITEDDVKNYHEKLLTILNQILDNPNINIKNIKI